MYSSSLRFLTGPLWSYTSTSLMILKEEGAMWYNLWLPSRLVYQDGILYESTGQYGESGIRKQDIKSGKILSALSIDNRLFGEGITLLNDKIYQLTWTSGKGFIYDLKTFSLESTFTYNTQGWGITTIGDNSFSNSFHDSSILTSIINKRF